MPLLSAANAHPRGGFLPFLVPAIAGLGSLLGSAAGVAGPALIAGTAGALGKSLIDRITGSGLPMLYHKPTDQWLVGHGIKDIFRKIAEKVTGVLSSNAAKRIGTAGRDAIIDATVDTLAGSRTPKPRPKPAPRPGPAKNRKTPPSRFTPTPPKPRPKPKASTQAAIAPTVVEPTDDYVDYYDPFANQLTRGSGRRRYR